MSRWRVSVHLGIAKNGQQYRACLHSDRIPNPYPWILLVFHRLPQKAMIQKLLVSILVDLNRSNLEPVVICIYNCWVTFKIQAWKGTVPAVTVWFWIRFCICFQVMSLVPFWLVCAVYFLTFATRGLVDSFQTLHVREKNSTRIMLSLWLLLSLSYLSPPHLPKWFPLNHNLFQLFSIRRLI